MSFMKTVKQNQTGPPFAIPEFKGLRRPKKSMILHLTVALIKSSPYAFLFLLLALEIFNHYMKIQKLIKGQQMECECWDPHTAMSHSAIILTSFSLPILPR